MKVHGFDIWSGLKRRSPFMLLLRPGILYIVSDEIDAASTNAWCGKHVVYGRVFLIGLDLW